MTVFTHLTLSTSHAVTFWIGIALALLVCIGSIHRVISLNACQRLIDALYHW